MMLGQLASYNTAAVLAMPGGNKACSHERSCFEPDSS